MDARMAVTHVVAQSGKTAKDVSLEMGLTSNFITNTKARKSAPRLDTFAHIAKVCGYKRYAATSSCSEAMARRSR